MKEVLLKKIILKNYMGAKDVIADFSQKTEIRGKNRCGKSTLMNAYFDVMTGKFANGSAPNNICPIDESGNEIPVKEIERAVVLSIDGEEHEIRKITKRKYRKDVFIGTETAYMLDGDTAKAADVNNFLSSIAPTETISMCSNAAIFLSALKKSTADARKAIEGLSGFDIEEFCKREEEYRTAYKMTAGKKVEDVLKQLKKNCKSENDVLNKLNVELDYENRRLSGMDKSDLQKLESEKSVIVGNIESMENQKEALNVSIDRYTFLLGHIEKLKKNMFEIEQEQTKLQTEKASTLNEKLSSTQAEIDRFATNLKEIESAEQKNEIFCALKRNEVDNSEKELARLKKLVFSGGNCPVCGRQWQEERIESDMEKFRKEKEESVRSVENAIISAKEEIKEVEEKRRFNTEKIAELTDSISAKTKEKERISAEKEETIAKIRFCKTSEYEKLEEELKESEKEASELFDSTDLWRQVTERISNLKEELSAKETEINAIIRDAEETERRIGDLETSVREQAQKVADVEYRMDMLQDFSIAKNAALEDAVNSKFEFIKIRMSEETLSGDTKETLKIIVNGVDYFNGLNHGDRILAEIYLLKGLQDMNGIKLPIWVDDTESLDESRTPDIGRQMLLIRRTDDEALNVCKMEG